MKQVSKILLIFLFVSCGKSIHSDDFATLTQNILDFKDVQFGAMLAKVRDVQRYFKDLNVGDSSDAAYNSALLDRAAAKVKLCKIVGKNSFEEQEVGGRENVQVCTARKAILMRAAFLVHPDKVDANIEKSDMSTKQAGCFVRALQVAYAGGYSGLLLAAHQDPTTFTIDTLYAPDEVGDEENASAVRIANLGKYVLELQKKAFENVTKKEDPMKVVQVMIDELNSFCGAKDYTGSRNSLPVGEALNGMRKQTLSADEVQAVVGRVEKVKSACERSETGIVAEYLSLVKEESGYQTIDPPRSAAAKRKKGANRRCQEDVNIIVRSFLDKILSFARRYQAILSSHADSSGEAGEASEFEAFIRPFTRETGKLAQLWNDTPALQEASVRGFASILNTARDVVVVRASELEVGATEEVKGDYLLEFQRAIHNLKTTLESNFVNLFDERAALQPYKVRVEAWIQSYKDVLNYVMENIYHEPKPFASDEGDAPGDTTGGDTGHGDSSGDTGSTVDPKTTDLLVDLSQTLRMVAK